MCENTGCCGSFIRVVLSLINIIFLIFGIAIFLLAALIKWGDISSISRLINNEDIKSIIDMSVFNTVAVVLLIFGGFIILLSLIGLIGACCANRFFLVIYELVIIALFLAHGCILIVGGIKSSDVEKEFRKTLNQTAHSLTSSNMTETEFKTKCQGFKIISQFFSCCGAESPSDFNKTLQQECCYGQTQVYGCSQQLISTVKTHGINVIIIPNSVILCFEFLLILIVPFLIGRITKGRRQDDDEEDRVNVKPTTYYRD